MAEQQLELIHEITRAFERKDVPAISNLYHPDYVHVTRPQSVNVPKQNKTQTLEYYQKMFDNWAKTATPNFTTIANTPGKVVVHVNGEVTLKTGSTVAYESVCHFHIVEDASGKMLMNYAEEFMDVNSFTGGFAPFLEAKT